MKIYYELDETGRIKGRYPVEQPGKVLHFLEEHPEGFHKRDGAPGENWIVDDDMVAAAGAAQAAQLAKEQAIIDNLPTWAQVETAIDACDTIPKLRAVVKKIARVVYWDVKNQET